MANLQNVKVDSDGFQLVKKRKAAKPSRNLQRSHDVACSSQDKNECLSKIQQAREEIEVSEGYSSLKRNLNSIEKELIPILPPQRSNKISSIVCYGLGQLSCSRIARTQAALLLILKDHFEVPVEAYDPIFSGVDREVLEELSVEILNTNEEGKRRVSGTTLFFLPHCGKELYNNLLWANWNASSLPLCVIIGNSFSAIFHNVPTRILKEHYAFIYNARDMFRETPLPSLVDCEDVFNDVNIHVPSDGVLKKSGEFWRLQDREPKYHKCDVEIVRKNS